MQKELIDLLDENVFQALFDKEGVSKEDLKVLGQSEAFVYGYPKHNPSEVYRLTHSSHRNVTDMQAEAEFILYLKSCGIQTMSSKYLKDNSLAMEIKCKKGTFVVTKYSFESGTAIDLGESKEQDLKLAKKWGVLFAKLHEASVLLKNDIRRDTIFEREWIDANLFVSNQEVLKKANQALTWLKSLEKTKENFGLIHGDLHTGNLLLDQNDEIIILDFDDSLYHFLVDDLAVVIHSYREANKLGVDWDLFEDDFTKTLLKSYESIRPIPDFFYKTLEKFVEFREISLYTFYHSKELHLKKSMSDYLKKMEKLILSYKDW